MTQIAANTKIQLSQSCEIWSTLSRIYEPKWSETKKLKLQKKNKISNSDNLHQLLHTARTVPNMRFGEGLPVRH